MVAVGWRILWQGIGGFVLTLFLGNIIVLSILPELTRSVDRGIRAIPLCLIATRRPRSDQRPLWDLPPSR